MPNENDRKDRSDTPSPGQGSTNPWNENRPSMGRGEDQGGEDVHGWLLESGLGWPGRSR